MTASLYRPEALAELDVTGKLDAQLRMAPPRRWLALLLIVVLVVAAAVWAVLGRAPQLVTGNGALLPSDGLIRLAPQVPGVLTAAIAPGVVAVHKGDRIVTLTAADGTTHDVVAPTDGDLVQRSPLSLGDPVTAGETLGAMIPAGDRSTSVVFVSPTAATAVRPGMEVYLSAAIAPASAYGRIVGHVAAVDRVPFDSAGVLQLTGGNQELARELTTAGTLRVVVTLDHADTPSGLRWTSTDGPGFTIPTASELDASIVTGARAPISFLFGG